MRMLLLAALSRWPVWRPPRRRPSPASLYAANCGEIAFENLSFFSDTGDYDGRPGRLVLPCYVIAIRSTLLWTRVSATATRKPATLARRHGQGCDVLVDELKASASRPPTSATSRSRPARRSHRNANLFPAATWILTRPNSRGHQRAAAFGVNARLQRLRAGEAAAHRRGLRCIRDGTVRICGRPGTRRVTVLVLKFARRAT